MSFTNDNNLERPDAGSSDWDTPLNANFQMLERGLHVRGTAGMQINTGEAVTFTSSGTVVTFDASSSDLEDIKGVSYSSVGSGEEGFFVHKGIVRSLDVNTFNFAIGEPVYVSSEFPGLLVSSDGSGSAYAAGFSVDTTALIISPFRTVTGGGGGGGGTDPASVNFWTGLDVVSAPAAGQSPRYNGTAWEPTDTLQVQQAGFRGAFATLTSTLTLGSGTDIIAYDDVDYDTDGIWSGANPSRLTVPSGATKVRIVAQYQLTSVDYDGGEIGFQAAIIRDGASFDAQAIQAVNANNGGEFLAPRGNLSTAVLSVTAGTYFEVQTFLSTSSARLSSNRNWFAMEIVETSAPTFISTVGSFPDVSTTAPTSGQVLMWSDATSLWTPTTI